MSKLKPNKLKNKSRILNIALLSILIVIIMLGLNFNKKNNTENIDLTSNKNVLIYSTEQITSENKVQTKSIYAYDLDKDEQRPASLSEINNGLPTSIKGLSFVKPYENEILFVTNDDNKVKIFSYIKADKSIKEIASIDLLQFKEGNSYYNWGSYFSIAPDKSKLAFTVLKDLNYSQIYILDLKTKELKRATTNINDDYPDWLNNNQLLFWSRNKSDTLKVLDIKTQKEDELIDLMENSLWNSLSMYTKTPDGKKIIFSSYFVKEDKGDLNVDGANIFEIDVNSHEVKKLFNIPYSSFVPKVSHDSNYLVWKSLVYGTHNSASIFSYEFKTGNIRLICDERKTMCGNFQIKDSDQIERLFLN